MFEKYQDIMTVSEVAEALHIGKNRVYKLLNQNLIKGFRIGSVWKISKRELEQYILDQSHKK